MRRHHHHHPDHSDFEEHFFGRHGHRGGHGHGFFGKFGGRGFRDDGLGGRGMRASRILAAGELQLVILSLLAEKPRHGYEIIKALEEHSSGFYSPSPGMIYPALTYLEELGYARSESEGNKKLFTITEAGTEHLEQSREVVKATLEQLATIGRKMASMQKLFAEGSDDFAGDPGDESYGERRQWKMELRELRDELKAALREKFNATAKEKKRIMEILRNAVREIRGE
jgi:DNA-binding PadR family transcriptional regulator